MISETEKAYMAAFLDGEGCIAITRRMTKQGRNYSYRLTLVLANNNRPVLESFQSVWGGALHWTRNNHSTLHFGAAQTKHILTECLPYFRIKKAEAELALAFYATFETRANTDWKQRAQFFERMKSIKKEKTTWCTETATPRQSVTAPH